MAIANALPEVWAAALLRNFSEQAVWAALSRDFSGDVSEYGKTLHINRITGTITVRSYVAGTDLEKAEAPDDEGVTLALDQHQYFNIKIPDVERLQARAEAFTEWRRQAMEKITNQFDRYVYGQFNAGWDDAGTDRTRFSYTKTPATVNAAWRAGLVAEGFKIVRKMDEAKWPVDQRWMVMTTEVKAHLLDYLVIDKATLGAGAMIDGALQNAALSNLFGCRVIMDPQLPTAAAENNPYMLFGTPGAIGHAVQLESLEFYRPESDFADAIKSLWIYGSARLDTARKFAVVQAA